MTPSDRADRSGRAEPEERADAAERAERADGRADPRVRRLADAVPEGVVWIEDGCVVGANEHFARLAGRGASLVGTKLVDLLVDLGDGLPGAAAARAVECAVVRADGERRTVVCHAAWRDADDGTSAYVVQDVTHVRRLESELLRTGRDLSRVHRELENLREQLRQERAEREQLLGVVSHELRTPVTVIGGYNRLLLAEEVGPLTEDQRRFLEESNRSCRRVDSFIGNLLEASRAVKGEAVLELGHGPVSPVIDEVVGMFRPLLAEHGLSLALDHEAGGAVGRFDRVRVEQILTNLLGNAVKFTPRGGSIEIATRTVATPDDPHVHRWIEVSVADSGPGIARPDRERVFEPYVQACEESAAGGLGLGLSICRRLVDAHGGRIWLEESAAGGCRFRFTLPAEEPRVATLDDEV